MRRPTATDYLSSAVSVLLWRFGFLLLITDFFSRTPDSAGYPWFPSVTDAGIYYLIALAMHLLLARRIATMRGWRFWLMPLVTVPMVSVLVYLLQWAPNVWFMLRMGVASVGDLTLQRIAAEESGALIRGFGRGLSLALIMAPDLIFLTYPLLMAHQFLIWLLYRLAANKTAAQGEADFSLPPHR